MANRSELNPYTPKNPPVKEVVSYNGANFHTSFWNVPEGVVRKGRVIFNHGFSEYDETYYWVFDAISAGGYEVFIFDQRGAGHTDPGSTRGYTNEHYVFDDLEFFMERNMKEVGEETKLFMGGHSMGGGIALNYGIHGKHRERLSGIYVTGPLVKIHPDSLPTGLVIGLAKITAKIFPRMKMNTDLNIEYITSNKDYQKFILNDPLQFPPVGTLRQLQDMLARGENLLKPAVAKKFDTVPLLIIHGTEDKVNDPASSQAFFNLIPIKDKKLKMLESSHHSPHVETKEIFDLHVAEILNFLDSH